MTFREKLADWISGGAISVYRESAEYWKSEWLTARGEITEERRKSNNLRNAIYRAWSGEE